MHVSTKRSERSIVAALIADFQRPARRWRRKVTSASTTASAKK
jgi:hypothetical protein